VAQAISLAEINPLITGDAEYADYDPLNVSQETMMSGYRLSVKLPAKPAAAPRRKSNVKCDDSVGSTSTKKSLDEQASQLGQPTLPKSQKAPTGKAKPTPKNPSMMAPTQQPQLARRVSAKGEVAPRRRPSKKLLPGDAMPRLPQPQIRADGETAWSWTICPTAGATARCHPECTSSTTNGSALSSSNGDIIWYYQFPTAIWSAFHTTSCVSSFMALLLTNSTLDMGCNNYNLSNSSRPFLLSLICYLNLLPIMLVLNNKRTNSDKWLKCE
jgi:hypothetical protein